MDAWNIDLKTFSAENYRKLGGDFPTTLASIQAVHSRAHLEVTTLVVPGISDDPDLFREEVEFLAGLDPDIPLHLSRYFPRYRYYEPATDPALLHKFKAIAEQFLNRVLVGNL